MEAIDLTPSWGEWGNVYRRFAETGETAACQELKPDFARAMASAQALQELCKRRLLTDEQVKLVGETMNEELQKQGVKP